jgi:AcrR family transcriptional regulator
MAQATKGRQTPLSKDLVVQTAVALADAGGFDSLSMRRLADELGTAPMSLYRHVKNKEKLLDEMVDVVFGEIDLPMDTDWKSALRRRGISSREALARHRWAIGLMESRMTPGPASAKHHNAVMGCLRGAGFSFRSAVHAYSVLDSYTYGFALQEQTIPFETPEESAEMAKTTVGSMGEEYPYLAEVVRELSKSGYDYGKEFEFGLDLILDAIEPMNDGFV